MIPKFRAWDSDKKEMFKDTFAITESGEVIICKQETIFNFPDYIFVYNLIVMQSTGLFDKNGVEVFIGDIVRCSQGCPHEVVFIREFGGMFVGGMPTIYLSDMSEGYAWTGDEEVIGNIYENPELVEERE